MTLVFHDQADSIAEAVTRYEAKLARANFPNIPLHSEPLMNGHKDYEFLNIEQRKVMLAYFSSFVRRLPISYITFVYRRSQFEDPARLMERMGRDISSAIIEHLGSYLLVVAFGSRISNAFRCNADSGGQGCRHVG